MRRRRILYTNPLVYECGLYRLNVTTFLRLGLAALRVIWKQQIT